MLRQVDQRFKEVDAFMNKKLYRGLIELSTETGTRLEQIERGSFAMQDSLKRDTQIKFTKLKEENAERSEKLEKELNTRIGKLHQELNGKISRIDD